MEGSMDRVLTLAEAFPDLAAAIGRRESASLDVQRSFSMRKVLPRTDTLEQCLAVYRYYQWDHIRDYHWPVTRAVKKIVRRAIRQTKTFADWVSLCQTMEGGADYFPEVYEGMKKRATTWQEWESVFIHVCPWCTSYQVQYNAMRAHRDVIDKLVGLVDDDPKRLARAVQAAELADHHPQLNELRQRLTKARKSQAVQQK